MKKLVKLQGVDNQIIWLLNLIWRVILNEWREYIIRAVRTKLILLNKEIVGLGTRPDWKKQENSGDRPTFKMDYLPSLKVLTYLLMTISQYLWSRRGCVFWKIYRNQTYCQLIWKMDFRATSSEELKVSSTSKILAVIEMRVVGYK